MVWLSLIQPSPTHTSHLPLASTHVLWCVRIRAESTDQGNAIEEEETMATVKVEDDDDEAEIVTVKVEDDTDNEADNEADTISEA